MSGPRRRARAAHSAPAKHLHSSRRSGWPGLLSAMRPASPPSAPTALLLLLVAKHTFVQANLDAGKVPTSAMLAAFLQALVAE